jgi:hypothetical protein
MKTTGRIRLQGKNITTYFVDSDDPIYSQPSMILIGGYYHERTKRTQDTPQKSTVDSSNPKKDQEP